MIFESNRYIGGFLFKWFPMLAIVSEGVRPSLAEMEIFQSGNHDDLKRDLEKMQVKERTTTSSPATKSVVHPLPFT